MREKWWKDESRNAKYKMVKLQLIYEFEAKDGEWPQHSFIRNFLFQRDTASVAVVHYGVILWVDNLIFKKWYTTRELIAHK